MAAVTLIGSPVSPYVRKVLAVCAAKGIEVELDPVTPFLTNDAFETLSPLRRIPVWIEGDVTLCDSSIIVQYIEETRPGPSLWPADPVQRAKARFIEEFADTRLFDVLGWKLFFQLALKPRFFGAEPDQTLVDQARDAEAPAMFDCWRARRPRAASCSATCRSPTSAWLRPFSTPGRSSWRSIPTAGRASPPGWSG